MSMPQKALSALVCIVVAFVLGFVARLPALMDRLENQAQTIRFDDTVSTAPLGAATAWQGVDTTPY